MHRCQRNMIRRGKRLSKERKIQLKSEAILRRKRSKKVLLLLLSSSFYVWNWVQKYIPIENEGEREKRKALLPIASWKLKAEWNWKFFPRQLALFWCNTVKSRFNESWFNEKSRFKKWNLVTKMEFHIKKSRFCVKSQFKEPMFADVGHSLNRGFTVNTAWKTPTLSDSHCITRPWKTKTMP